MKKTYIQPQTEIVNLDITNAILAASNIHISNNPVDHFDSSKMNGQHPIWG